MAEAKFNEYRNYTNPLTDAWVNGVMRRIEPNYFITYNFNRPFTLAGAQDAIRQWHDRCDRKIIGPEYINLQSGRTAGVVVFEHILTNLHGHAPLRAASACDKRSSEQIEEIYAATWRRRVPGGTLHIAKADPPTLARMLHYLTKEASRPGFFDELLVL